MLRTCNGHWISELYRPDGKRRRTTGDLSEWIENIRSAQCVHKNRVLYHCTLLYDTDLTALYKALNPEPMVDDETLSSVYAVPSVRSEVTNIRSYLPEGTVTDFKEKAFQYFSKSQSVSAFTRKEIEAVNQLREEKYIQKEWIYSR